MLSVVVICCLNEDLYISYFFCHYQPIFFTKIPLVATSWLPFMPIIIWCISTSRGWWGVSVASPGQVPGVGGAGLGASGHGHHQPLHSCTPRWCYNLESMTQWINNFEHFYIIWSNIFNQAKSHSSCPWFVQVVLNYPGVGLRWGASVAAASSDHTIISISTDVCAGAWSCHYSWSVITTTRGQHSPHPHTLQHSLWMVASRRMEFVRKM